MCASRGLTPEANVETNDYDNECNEGALDSPFFSNFYFVVT